MWIPALNRTKGWDINDVYQCTYSDGMGKGRTRDDI